MKDIRDMIMEEYREDDRAYMYAVTLYDGIDMFIDCDMFTHVPTSFRNMLVNMSDHVDALHKYPPEGTCDMTAEERADRLYSELARAYKHYVPNADENAVKNDFSIGNFDAHIDTFDDDYFFKNKPKPETFAQLCDARQRGVDLMSHRDSRIASSMIAQGKYGCESRELPSRVLSMQSGSNLQLDKESCDVIDRINDGLIMEKLELERRKYGDDFLNRRSYEFDFAVDDDMTDDYDF